MRNAMLILAAATLIFGCSKNETSSSTTSTTETTATMATAAPPPAAQPVPAPATTTTAASAPAAPASAAIAGSDGEKPGMHIDITELKRASGGTVNLKFVLSNNTSERVGMWRFLGGKDTNDDNDVSGVTLVDPVGKKKYFVVTDTEKSCLCSRKVDHIDANSKLNLWAKYPAPPPDVTKVSIEIPHFQPIDDVPISQ